MFFWGISKELNISPIIIYIFRTILYSRFDTEFVKFRHNLQLVSHSESVNES